MDKLLKNILEYKSKLNLTTEACAENLQLDIEKMNEFAKAIIGTHDFYAFSSGIPIRSP